MITSLRKFSSSIYAKILFGIIIIPFVFWGMGSSFVGGNKNIVLSIDKEKYSTQDFVNFIRRFSSPNQTITADQIEEILTIYIGKKFTTKNPIKFMSHPCGSYNNHTLEILKELGIELGFKQIMIIEPEKGMKKINNSFLEIARQDHAEIIKMMSK